MSILGCKHVISLSNTLHTLRFALPSSSHLSGYLTVLPVTRIRNLSSFTLKCLSIGTPETINIPFVSNGKLMVLGVPIFKHIMMRL